LYLGSVEAVYLGENLMEAYPHHRLNLHNKFTTSHLNHWKLGSLLLRVFTCMLVIIYDKNTMSFPKLRGQKKKLMPKNYVVIFLYPLTTIK
jgi:hypothetical protein